MITLQELNPKNYILTAEQKQNLATLHERMNRVRAEYGRPMAVTSGVRDLAHHRRIYEDQARAKGISNFRVPMGSMHLRAAAVDILDRDGALYAWCKSNEAFLAQVGLWMEEDQSQPRVHFQIYPPKSGNRWFRP